MGQRAGRRRRARTREQQRRRETASAQPGLAAEHETRDAQDPDAEGDGHRGIEVAALEPASPTTIPAERSATETKWCAAERRSSASSGGTPQAQNPARRGASAGAPPTGRAPAIPAARVNPAKPASIRPTWTASSPPGSSPRRDAGAATRPGRDEERRRERHHGEPEQPVAGRAAPDQVGADDEPDEQVERARPGAPRKAVAAERLDDEQRRLGEPADADAPDREPAATARRRATRPRRRRPPRRRRSARARRAAQPSA